MKLIITILAISLISIKLEASNNEYFNDCKKLKNEIEFNIYNYFANLKKENLRKYPDHKERARDFLDIASKQANVYNVICNDN